MSASPDSEKLGPSACVGANIRRANRMVSQFYDEALRPSGLRITQFSLLVRIRELAPTTINRLAESAAMDRTTLTRNLRPLEKQGLISINPASDRRMREVRLTKEGGGAMLRALPHWKQAQEHMREGLGEARYNRLLGDLKEAIRISQA